MIIDIIEQLFWFLFLSFIAYKGYDLARFYLDMERCRGIRFVTVPAHLKFGVSDNDDSEDDDYSDPELRRILRDGKIDDPQKIAKVVNIRYTIDLDTVKSYHEYTTDSSDNDIVHLNCTYISFTDLASVVIDLPFDQFDDLMTAYNNQRYHIA